MKKKVYNQPRVETMQLMPSTVVLAGSSNGLPVDNTPIGNGEGGD